VNSSRPGPETHRAEPPASRFSRADTRLARRSNTRAPNHPTHAQHERAWGGGSGHHEADGVRLVLQVRLRMGRGAISVPTATLPLAASASGRRRTKHRRPLRQHRA
jgi:hypothetical protein